MPSPNVGVPDTGVLSGVKEFVFAKLETQQSTNIGAGDHLKFDTVIDSRNPSQSIVLDTSTAYSNSAGAASIGRFTLKAGRRYHLRASIPYILGSGATGALTVQFYDATNSAVIAGGQQTLLVATTATNDIGGGYAESFITPTSDILVELRIITVAALTRIGTTSTQVPTVLIESDV